MARTLPLETHFPTRDCNLIEFPLLLRVNRLVDHFGIICALAEPQLTALSGSCTGERWAARTLSTCAETGAVDHVSLGLLTWAGASWPQDFSRRHMVKMLMIILPGL